MSKFKRSILPIVFIVFALAVICTGLYFLNVFSGITLPVAGKPDDSTVKSNSEIIDELLLLNLADSTAALSDDMRALWLNAGEDFGVAPEEGTEAVKYAVYSDMNYYKNFLPDTLFIKPDIKGVYSSLKENDGTVFDILSYIFYYADQFSLDKVLIADEDILFSESGEFTTDNIVSYLSAYSFDGVLFSAESLFGTSDLCEYVEKLSKFLSDNYPDIIFGTEVNTDTEAMFADEFVVSLFEKKICDFGYVDISFSTEDENYPFKSVALWWNSFADYYDIPFYCEHRLDKVFVNNGGWSYGSEISSQMEALHFCPAFDGSVFYGVSSVEEKKPLAMDLSIFINDVAGTIQKSMNIQSLEINTDNSVTFAGLVNVENVNVYCSDEIVETQDGEFRVTYPLLPSRNVFDFRSNGAIYNYKIDNNVKLIHAYTPTENVSTEADKIVSSVAVCPSGAKVFAVVGGNYYEMNENTAVSSADIPSGYSLYSCSVDFSDIAVKSELLSLLCCYKGKHERVDCCYIGNDTTSLTEEGVYSDGFSAVLSPYSDNGCGTSLMCITDCDNTEQISKPDDYDTYHPDRSALLKGTIDYIDKISVSPEGYLIYELKSGINVYGVDSVLINNGYNMPLNNVVLTGFDDSSDKETKFTFIVDWLSPITVSPQQLDYKVGHMEFAYNISEFNAQYFDLTFHYTGSLSGDSLIALTSSSVFSSYEIYKTDNDGMILRLYLSKPGKFYGFDLNEVSDGVVEVTFKKRLDDSISGKVIMVDPGHGGLSMIGTAVKDNSVGEAAVTLNIAGYVKTYLENMGATVIMTRVSDTSMLLSERTYMSETINPDIFVSIHCDGSDSLYESGTHTFYYTPFSQPLASAIHNSLVKTYTENIYSEADENFGRIDRKIKYYPFYVTRIDNCPSVLIETGFMTNYVEGNVLINPVNQDILAKAIAEGIADYFRVTY
ncbi:MAG: N-acetylmuramoyl-L-alanine amidase [Clostridia bacterium]|nr:N-acetylmuramoyl-L-alanine amidase [Clostridia bacterium]